MKLLLVALWVLASRADDRNIDVYVEINGVPAYTHEDGPELAHEIPKGCGRCRITIRKDAAIYVVNFKRWYGQWRWSVYTWKDGREAQHGTSTPFMAGSDCGRAIQRLIDRKK